MTEELCPAEAERRILRPPLKWAGGKRWLVPLIRELWNEYPGRRMVEPMCGGLSASLGIMPERAYLNDANPYLINFYNQLKKGLTVDIHMENEKEQYYAMRKRFNTLAREGKALTSESAQLFYYLNRTCYNGLCRLNSKGEFNVPFGKYSRINYASDFTTYKEVFKKWEFTSLDFSEIRISKDDFVYADPPYDVEFTSYSSSRFGWDKQVELAEWASSLDVPVVISNQSTDRIKKLYSKYGFTLYTTMAPRAISCNGDRSKVEEVVATYNMPARDSLIGGPAIVQQS